MRSAINKHCKDCIYDDCVPGAWRMQVEACTVKTCALYELRPKSSKGIKSKRENNNELDESFGI